MRIFARPLPLPAVRRSPSARPLGLLAALAATLTTLLMLATPAGAAVTEVEGVKVGVQARNGTGLGTTGSEPETFANENGNVVLHGSGDYVIYWDPGNQLHHEWLVKVDGFFRGLGEAGLATGFASLGQYRDRSNALAPFHALSKGAYSDTAKFPVAGCTDPHALEVGAVTCLTDAQLREQLKSFIAARGLPTGMGTVYFLVTPPGVTVCLDGAASRCSDYKLTAGEITKKERVSTSYKGSFCSYHGAINPNKAAQGDASTILYAAIPWTAGTLGLAGYRPTSSLYAEAFDCQDGGFNSEKNEENREEERVLTAAEELALTKDTPAKVAEEEKIRRLEGPHQQEPNQEGKSEEGDYSAGLADLLVNQIADQEASIVTDPLLTSWQDAKGNEVTDICRNVFAGTGSKGVTGSVTADLKTEAGFLSNVSLGESRFYLNNVFSLASHACEGGIGLVPRFTSPNPVNSSEIIGFDGMESTVSLVKALAFGPSGPPTTTYATFSWNYGDGTPEVKGYAPGAPTCEAPWLSPCAASTFHSYQYGGVYKVTLTITDAAGNISAITKEVTVVGPAPPAPAATPGTSAAASAAAAATPTVPKPIATASVISRTLRSAAKGGVVVRYTVNEQVAGRFEVLLPQTVARRLGISGAPAVGLPAGTAPQLVVAKAVIVTTSGGHSTASLQFSKRTAQRLSKQHKVVFMLRMIVRNAAAHAPTSTTVLSSFTLTH